MTQNQDEPYFHNLGHGARGVVHNILYRGCFGDLLREPVLPCLMDFQKRRLLIFSTLLNLLLDGRAKRNGAIQPRYLEKESKS